MNCNFSLRTLLLTATIAVPFQCLAASDYCKAVIESVAKTGSKQLTQTEMDKCRGPLIADALCRGWREGKSNIGCKDHQTSLVWSKSNDTDLRTKGEACLGGATSMDVKCGLN